MGKAMGSLAAVLSLVGMLFAIDARYWRVQAGEAAVAAVKADIGKLSLSVEELRLKNEIATARLRVQFLAGRVKPTVDELEELAYVRAQLALQQKQLIDVQAKK